MDEAKKLSQLRLTALLAVGHHLAAEGCNVPAWNFFELQRLLGYANYPDFVEKSKRDAAILAALAGPHGYAIYKMLKARKNAT